MGQFDKPSNGPGATALLSTAQNIVQAVGTVSADYMRVQGTAVAKDIAAATLVVQGPARLCTVVVTAAGSAAGAIYDGNAASVTSGVVYVIPMTVGVQVVNMPVTSGIVVAPGTGQKVAISYSS